MTKQRRIRPTPSHLGPGIPLPVFSNEPSGTYTPEISNVSGDLSFPSTTKNHWEQITDRVLREIPIHLIDPHPIAPREIYTPEMISERAEDLRTQGQHDPIHVIPNPNVDGRYIICDGWTRVLACVQHKIFDKLLAEIHSDLDLRESAWFGYQQNEGRTQQCDFDLAMFYAKLLENGESAAEIARRHKRSKTQMSFYKAFTELPTTILELVKANKDKFGATAAYHLAAIHNKCGEEIAVKTACEFIADDKSVRWLATQAKEVMKSITRSNRTQTSSKVVRYVNEFGNGFFKQRGNYFELSISVDPEYRDNFSQAIEELLAKVANQENTTTEA